MGTTCIACGMPMREKDEFALGDTSKEYCVHCMNEDGSLQSFEDKKRGLVAFIIKTQGVSEGTAEEAALASMRKLPAWKDCF